MNNINSLENIHFFIDICPLLEKEYSGIPQVTKEIARNFLTKNNVTFYIDDVVIPNEFVENTIKINGPVWLDVALSEVKNLISLYDVLYQKKNCKKIGLFTNRITRTCFDFNALIVHDISYILDYSVHSKETINFHCLDIERNKHLVDLFLPVSTSTAEDIIYYLGYEKEKIKVLPIGAEMPQMFKIPQILKGNEKPFALFLGTLEPRKNISSILEVISKNKYLLEKIDFYFCGKVGWMQDYNNLLKRYDLLEEEKSGFLKRLDYISEEKKWILLQRCKFLIFPSFFEGFGMPIAEAIQAKTNIIASHTSSLKEASNGYKFCKHIDPLNYEQLLKEITNIVNNEINVVQDLEQVFSWKNYTNNLQRIILEKI